MAGENSSNGKNGKNGKTTGILGRVATEVKADLQSLKTDLPAKAKEQVDLLKDPTKTQVFTSIFRHKHDDTPRNRALGVLSNVFLHLHPAKINRDAVRYSFTWGMGGITFYLFIVLTFTGVLLMLCSITTPPRYRHSGMCSTWSMTCPLGSCCATCIVGRHT